MRYVDLTQLEDELDQAWHERAAAAGAETRSCQPDERAKVIGNGREIWRDAGRVAARLTGGRCWYCDMRQVRSDMPVDHFRPKGRVAEAKLHPGYWWLAFDWKNFRYACTFCNSRRIDVDSSSEGGKQDHFPLLSKSKRACCEDDVLSLEFVALLDPCVHQDPGLLTFRQDGRCVSRYDDGEDPRAAERVRESVRLYHLDHPGLIPERREIWKRVEVLVKRGEAYLADGRSLDEVKADLHELIKPTRPLSRVAKLAIRGRRDVSWIRDWLEEIETTL